MPVKVRMLIELETKELKEPVLNFDVSCSHISLPNLVPRKKARMTASLLKKQKARE